MRTKVHCIAAYQAAKRWFMTHWLEAELWNIWSWNDPLQCTGATSRAMAGAWVQTRLFKNNEYNVSNLFRADLLSDNMQLISCEAR